MLLVVLALAEPLDRESPPLVERARTAIDLEGVQAQAVRPPLLRELHEPRPDTVIEPVRSYVELVEVVFIERQEPDDGPAGLDGDPRLLAGDNFVADPAPGRPRQDEPAGTDTSP